jgi:hypothetical protein
MPEMKPWEAMRLAIPSHLTEEIAKRVGVSTDFIRRMRRKPASEESPTATGQTNPVQRLLQIHDTLMLIYPEGAGILMAYFNSHHDSASQSAISETDRHSIAMVCLTSLSRAVNAINIGDDPAEIEREILEAMASFQKALLCVRAGRFNSNLQLKKAG